MIYTIQNNIQTKIWKSGFWFLWKYYLNIFKKEWKTWIEYIKSCKHCQRDKRLSQWCSLQLYAAAAAKSLQSCPTLCDPTDSSPPGSPILGILKARTLEWVAISFSNAWKWRVKVKSLSHVWLLVIPWTAAYQAPASMGFSRQEYWSGVPLPSLLQLYVWY